MKKKILIIFGTRPELLKLFNIIKILTNDNDIDLKVLNTSQHSDLLKTHLNTLPIKIDLISKNMLCLYWKMLKIDFQRW